MARENQQSERSGRSRRGFASMDPEEQREIASRGGRASHGGRGRQYEDENEDFGNRRSGRRSSSYYDEGEDADRGQGRGSSRRGFAGMDREEQREISSRGGHMSSRMQDRDEYGQFAGEDEEDWGGRSAGRRSFSAFDEDEDEDFGNRRSSGRRSSSSYDEEEDEGRGQSRGSSRRGFASMDPEEQREIASRGGRASARAQNRDEYGQFAGEDEDDHRQSRRGRSSGGGSRSRR